MVEVYPSGTGVKDQVGVGVGGECVDGDAGVGVFEDQVNEALCGGGCGLVGVGVDVAGGLTPGKWTRRGLAMLL
ncbi:hypothetical protein [uncultured Corynebacterium sp.]|uniref:hypothetical protein n=1 Tax=uncultured Corynebacterium sp. TaxID=159447 RepID=UPI0028041E89|nr:hypothetical protein [uncultured Corynebacterium sp.]